MTDTLGTCYFCFEPAIIDSTTKSKIAKVIGRRSICKRCIGELKAL